MELKNIIYKEWKYHKHSYFTLSVLSILHSAQCSIIDTRITVQLYNCTNCSLVITLPFHPIFSKFTIYKLYVILLTDSLELVTWHQVLINQDIF